MSRFVSRAAAMGQSAISSAPVAAPKPSHSLEQARSRARSLFREVRSVPSRARARNSRAGRGPSAPPCTRRARAQTPACVVDGTPGWEGRQRAAGGVVCGDRVTITRHCIPAVRGPSLASGRGLGGGFDWRRLRRGGGKQGF